MINIKNIEKLKENNMLEAKKAQAGLPHSIWTTYSSFANTLGGMIILGVEEQTDKSLNVVGLSNPEKIVQDFWNTINNLSKVSTNIIPSKNVIIEKINDNNIVIIQVPRADRNDRPVYIGDNPLVGTYRRNGDGDYKCTSEEVKAMMRDAYFKTQDMKLIDTMDLSVLDFDSIKRYRNRMKIHRPGHVWETLDDKDFLYKIGAIGKSLNGKFHPTGAGLLMFGYEYEIVKEFPFYFLDYQENFDYDNRWTDRIISTSGDWSGNLYDFYFRVYNKISQTLKVPFKLVGGDRIDDTPVHKAIREALANSLINADYYERQGVKIIRNKDSISISNPGGFRIELETALSGGISDPRNSVLIKIFNLIDIGERAGSGIPNIFNVWENQGWNRPLIKESFNPNRVTLLLSTEEKKFEKSNYKRPTIQTGDKMPVIETDDKKTIIKTGDKKVAIKTGDKKVAIKTGDKKPVIKTGDKRPAIKNNNMLNFNKEETISLYLYENKNAKNADITKLLGLKPSRVREILKNMVDKGIIIAEGNNKSRVYKLKEQ